MQINKRIIILEILMLSVVSLKGQTEDANYVEMQTMLDSNANIVKKDIQYYDLKGRACQYVSMAPSSGYLHVFKSYDMWNREQIITLPLYSNINDYDVAPDISGKSSATYNGDSYGYTKILYGIADHPRQKIMPGKEWQDDDVRQNFTYGVNASNSVKIYTAPLGKNCSLVNANEYYNAGDLSSVKVTDEDGHSKEVFTNKIGQKILEREYNNNDTYYVYNVLGQLRFVLSPMYQINDNKEEYVYEYQYDNRGRIIEKKLPGCKPIQYWYDSKDRLIFMQDGSLLLKNIYRFYLYDALNRLCVQGTCSSCNKGTDYSADVSYSGATGVDGSGYVLSNSSVLKNPTCEIVNFYDNYYYMKGQIFSDNNCIDTLNCLNNLFDGRHTISSQINCLDNSGLETGQLQRTSDGRILFDAYFYDTLARLVRINEFMPGCYSYKKAMELTFTGKIKSVMTQFNYQGKQYYTYINNFFDTRTELPVNSFISFQGKPEVNLLKLKYDPIGRIISKQIGKNLRVTTYDYNIRSWIRHLKAPGFDQELQYTALETEDGSGNFNGNISLNKWKSTKDSIYNIYTYDYNGINRLADASYEQSDYSKKTFDLYSQSFIYDRNGNILTLKRNGKKSDGSFGLIDDLKYSYVGNQISRLDDAADPVLDNGSTDFKDKQNATIEYTYNGNGAIISDINKGINKIVYDQFNNPKSILFANCNEINYEYAADGRKLKKVYFTSRPTPFINSGGVDSGNFDGGIKSSTGNFSNLPVSSNHNLPDQNANLMLISKDSVEYYGNCLIKNSKVDKILFDGGYISINSGEKFFDYNYYTYDYQGNIRAVYTDDSIKEINTYDAIGNIIPDKSFNIAYQSYKYNGKEYDHTYGLNFYDYGARNYDSEIGRWHSIDPLCEKHYDISPYAYCADNPVNRIDQNGMDWAKDSTNHVFYNKDWNENNIPKGYTYVGKECDYFYDGENGIDCCHGEADGSETMLYHQDDGEIIGRKPSDDPDQAASDTDKSAVDTSGLAGKANMAVGAGGAAIGVKNAMIGGTANIVNGKSFRAVKQDVASAFGHTTGTYFKFFSHLGNIAGAFNAGYSAVDLYKNWSNGNYAAAARDGADITMTFVGVFGGPAGDIVSAAYFIGTTIYDKN